MPALDPRSVPIISTAFQQRLRIRYLSLEGLRPRQQSTHHVAARNRVPSPLLLACVAQGIRQNPVFWVSRKSIPRALSLAQPRTVGLQSPAILRPLASSCHLALPPMRRHHGPSLQTLRRGALVVRLLRYLLMLSPILDRRRAHRTLAHSCIHTSKKHCLTYSANAAPPFRPQKTEDLQRSSSNSQPSTAPYLTLRHLKNSIHFP